MNFTAKPLDALPDVKLIIGEVYKDHRGVFTESYREKQFEADLGLPVFVQGNVSISHLGVARGLHYQVTKPQGKLMRTVYGRTLNIAVDMRLGSSTFGGVAWTVLDVPQHALWVPPGFANGFIALEDYTSVCYECSTYHYVGSDRALSMSGYLVPIIGQTDILRDIVIGEPGDGLHDLIISDKDAAAPMFSQAEPVPESEWRA